MRFELGQFHRQNALAFVDTSTHGTPSPVTAHDGERTVRMIAAACDATQHGQRRTIES